MKCPECGLPTECRECKSAEEEIDRLYKKIEDLREDLHKARTETDSEIADVRNEMTKAAEEEAARAIDLFNALFTLLEGMIAGTEQYADLEVPRLRKHVEIWIRDNT